MKKLLVWGSRKTFVLLAPAVLISLAVPIINPGFTASVILVVTALIIGIFALVSWGTTNPFSRE